MKNTVDILYNHLIAFIFFKFLLSRVLNK